MDGFVHRLFILFLYTASRVLGSESDSLSHQRVLDFLSSTTPGSAAAAGEPRGVAGHRQNSYTRERTRRGRGREATQPQEDSVDKINDWTLVAAFV